VSIAGEPSEEDGTNDGFQFEPLHGAACLIRASGGEWRVPATSTYSDEKHLRDILATNPSIIPGVSDPRAQAVIEFPLRTVSADVVIVDSTGSITVCETKLARNPEIRRKVVGQVLEYAAKLSEMSLVDFEESWQSSKPYISLVDAVLGASADTDERGTFRNAVAETLTHGRFRVLIVADALTDELRLIARYLGDHTDFEFNVLELAFAQCDGIEILIPRVTVGTQKQSTTSTRTGVRVPIADSIERVAAVADDAAPGFGVVTRQVLEGLAHSLVYV
jgi:hypothetical protein